MAHGEGLDSGMVFSHAPFCVQEFVVRRFQIDTFPYFPGLSQFWKKCVLRKGIRALYYRHEGYINLMYSGRIERSSGRDFSALFIRPVGSIHCTCLFFRLRGYGFLHAVIILPGGW